ncbi:MAG: ABC transporter permease subunit [Pirellulales bacterium]|nr:ABC transporter permease subunit [Pirellulales bacterium]
MIRPYLTVVKDSFNEAFASRVLWILLIVLTLILLGLAPMGLREESTTRLRLDSIGDWPALITRIERESQSATPSPGKRIWQLSDDSFKETIRGALESEKNEPDGGVQTLGEADLSRDAASRLLDDLNKMLERRDFYDAAAWSAIKLDAETAELLGKGVDRIAQGDLVLLNRQLFKAAFPAEVARLPDKELHLSYFTWPIGSPIPASRDMAEPVINQVVAGIMGFFVGTVAVFVAILVTAPIIPHMFDAGAIDLLLSKPVVRSLLFLAKFAGGCAFIVLSAGYFLVGLWLIMGLRFGLWNHAILLCIPLFLFLFSIYYSVSAAAAVLWKNAIVSVVITILFWFLCTIVGTAKNVVETVFLRPNAIVRMVPTDESLVAVNQAGEFLDWRSNRWETIVGPDRMESNPFGFGGVLIGPVFEPKQKRLLYLRESMAHRFAFITPSPTLTELTWTAGTWQSRTGPAPPRGTSWLFLGPGGEVLVVAAAGVFRLDEHVPSPSKDSPAADVVAPGAAEEKPREVAEQPAAKDPSGPAAASAKLGVDTIAKLLGVRLPTTEADPYVALGPEARLFLASPFSAAMDPVSGDVVVLGSGRLTYLKRDPAGRYRRGPERDLGEAVGPAVLAMAGGTVAVADRQGKVLMLDAKNLETRRQFRLGGSGDPSMALATPDGRRLAILSHTGNLIVCDADGMNRTTIGGDVSAVALDAEGRLLVADRFTRVTTYDVDLLRVVERRQPKLDVLGGVYHYFIRPFYTVFPKPGELDNVVHYLLTGEQSVGQGPAAAQDARQPRIRIDVAGPIWSSLAFVAVVLALTCVHIHRMDF